MEKKTVQNTITINAPAAKVWDLLTNGEQTKKYMFGCETVSNWQPGSPLLWRMNYEGKELVPVKGTVLEIVPNELLRYTVIDPNAAYPETPENHLNVTYELAAQDGTTTLVVTQDGFEGAADGDRRYQDVYNNGDGWNPILTQIKAIAEGE